MKKLSVLLCAAAMIFASCSKDKSQPEGESKYVFLRINSVTPASRAVEAPGVNTAGTIQLADGIVFIAGPTGSIIHRFPLVVADATSAAGQNIGRVPNNSQVLVVGNTGTSQTDLMACATLDAVQAVSANIQSQTDYKKVALSAASAVTTGSPASGATVTLNLTLIPAISRLEIAQVKALSQAEELAKAQAAAAVAGTPAPTTAAYITGFEIAGVYVDRYFPRFTFGGGNAGNYHEQLISDDFTGILPFMKNEEGWVAAGTPPVAAPAAGNVWAYNVASGGVVPRPIIKLTDITYMDAAGAAQTLTGARYITIGHYNDAGTTTEIRAFERGKIYRIGGTSGLSFSIEDTSTTPNPDSEELILKVGVTIQEWVLVNPDGVLQ